MRKMRSSKEGRERLEADGRTHTRGCECPRCEAGFTPSEHDREVAGLRAAAERGRRAAARAFERRKERARLAQVDHDLYFRRAQEVADAEVERLRQSRRLAMADRRMADLLRLRREGLSLESAIAEVDRRFRDDGSPAAENDNGWGDDRVEATGPPSPLFPGQAEPATARRAVHVAVALGEQGRLREFGCVGPAGLEPATYGLKVRSSTS